MHTLCEQHTLGTKVAPNQEKGTKLNEHRIEF
jgi:hypothetical protein